MGSKKHGRTETAKKKEQEEHEEEKKLDVLILMASIIGYAVVGVLTGGFVYGSFDTYANLKSTLFALFWPIGWFLMIFGAAVKWLTQK